MYCYCIEKSEIQKKSSANENSSHFENLRGCLQVFVLWGLAGMTLWLYQFIHRAFMAHENDKKFSFLGILDQS